MGATQFVNNIIDTIPSNLYGMIWLAISDSRRWKDIDTNCAYVQELLSAVKKRGKRTGILTLENDWNSVVANSTACQMLGNEPLYYIEFDAKPNFDDFKPFGGWKKPTMKAYDIGQIDTAYFGYLYYE